MQEASIWQEAKNQTAFFCLINEPLKRVVVPYSGNLNIELF